MNILLCSFDNNNLATVTFSVPLKIGVIINNDNIYPFYLGKNDFFGF